MGELLETRSYDIKESVFNGETEAIMYVTKDIYNDSYIVAVPVITLSVQIWNKHDYDYISKSNIFGDKSKQQRLIDEIKKAIAEFE